MSYVGLVHYRGPETMDQQDNVPNADIAVVMNLPSSETKRRAIRNLERRKGFRRDDVRTVR